MENLTKVLELLRDGLSDTEKAEAQRLRGNLKNLIGVEDDPKKEKERQEHKKAIAEVYYIIGNLEESAAARIPASFRKFLEERKWENYIPKDLSHLRDEAYYLLDIAYRHFLSPPEDKERLQLKYYTDSCLHALKAMKETAPSRLPHADDYARRFASAKTEDELFSLAKECGLEEHLRFTMEKEEKIALLFS